MGQGGCIFDSQLHEAIKHKLWNATTTKRKDIFASFGLVGWLHLESDWSESEVEASSFNLCNLLEQEQSL